MSEQKVWLQLGSVYFFVNLESAREPHFFESFHGHFFERFHRHFCVVHGHLFCGSRAVSEIHGHAVFHGSRPLLKFTGTFFPVHRYFLAVHGHIFVNCSRAKKNINGQFFKNVHGEKKNIHRHFFQKVHGHIFNVHGKKIL